MIKLINIQKKITSRFIQLLTLLLLMPLPPAFADFPPSHQNEITLRHRQVTLKVQPSLGGSITELRWRDQHLLRPAKVNNTNILETSYFPMVPIVNRIPQGKFQFNNKNIDLPENFDLAPGFMHGHGWQNSWRVTSKNSR